MLSFVEVMTSPRLAVRQLVIGPQWGTPAGGALRVMLMLFGVLVAGLGWWLYRSASGER